MLAHYLIKYSHLENISFAMLNNTLFDVFEASKNMVGGLDGCMNRYITYHLRKTVARWIYRAHSVNCEQKFLCVISQAETHLLLITKRGRLRLSKNFNSTHWVSFSFDNFIFDPNCARSFVDLEISNIFSAYTLITVWCFSKTFFFLFLSCIISYKLLVFLSCISKTE